MANSNISNVMTTMVGGGGGGGASTCYTINLPRILPSYSLTGNVNISGTSFSNVITHIPSAPLTVTPSASLQVNGENADIVINGVSLMATLNMLSKRLNMLVPNPKLEKEWEELKQLNDQYRALEADLKEKMEMWDILRNTGDGE
jgi:hypothetical protein